MTVHPDRYSTTGVVSRKMGVVLHDSETGDNTATSLINTFTRPGDRAIPGSNPPRRYGSSYHAVALNTNDAYTELLPATAGPYAAPPLNKTWWHFCIPGRANQTRTEWLDTPSRSGIRAAAQFIVAKSRIDGFALQRLTPTDLTGGLTGYCSHGDVSAAYKQTTHTDPGPNFPWDVLAADIALFLHPTNPEEPDMTAATLWRHPAYQNTFLIGAGDTINVSPQVYDSLIARGVPVIVDPHDQMLKGCMTQAGLTLTDMVPT